MPTPPLPQEPQQEGSHREPNDLEYALSQWLDQIDIELALSEIPPSERVFHATIKFVESAVQEVSNDSSDLDDLNTYAGKDWFASLYKSTQDWYDKKYGDAMKRPASTLKSLVTIEHARYELAVPMTHSSLGVISRCRRAFRRLWGSICIRNFNGSIGRA